MSTGYWIAWALVSVGNAVLFVSAVRLRVADRHVIEQVRASLRSRGVRDRECTCTPVRVHVENCPEATVTRRPDDG